MQEKLEVLQPTMFYNREYYPKNKQPQTCVTAQIVVFLLLND